MAELRSRMDTATDGALTSEFGVVSGELELRSALGDDGTLQLDVAYLGSDEWYPLVGSGCQLHDERDHDVVHDLVVGLLSRPSATQE